ncbi:MAG: ATP-binding protein [Burkholderiales bacterium]
MRPRSLFGRMVLILVLGLVLAQALGFAIHRWDRERMFFKNYAAQTAQRISDIISLLDQLSPAGRERVIAILNTRRWSASLSAAPEPLLYSAQDQGLAEFGRAVKPLISSRNHSVGVHQNTYAVAAQLSGGGWVTLGYRRDATIVPDVLLWTWLAVAIVIVVVTLIAARWVTRPLSVLAKAAESLGRDIDRPPLAETGPSEVRRAARAFNTMQTRLKQFIEDRARTFTAMSHDLKTPITRMRLRAEMLESPALKAKFAADLEQMQSMVDSTLAFMRGMQDDEAPRPVDVAALLESIQADAQETGQGFAIEGQTAAPYHGKPLALKRLLSNLIENALRYGGNAKVLIADDLQNLRIRVRDSGAGIPDAELERVFEPFYRLEASRNRQSGGTGLGLSIARTIAHLHGGDILLRNLAEGGLEAMLILPRRAVVAVRDNERFELKARRSPSPLDADGWGEGDHQPGERRA